MKPKAIESESNEHLITQKDCDELLQERMDEILEMSKKVIYKSLICDFKGPTSSLSFLIFGGPMYTYGKFKKMVKQHYNN